MVSQIHTFITAVGLVVFISYTYVNKCISYVVVRQNEYMHMPKGLNFVIFSYIPNVPKLKISNPQLNYPRPSLCTQRYCSAVSCALLNFQ